MGNCTSCTPAQDTHAFADYNATATRVASYTPVTIAQRKKTSAVAQTHNLEGSRRSNRAVMASCVRPCPSVHVLRAKKDEGVACAAAHRGSRELLHAAGEGHLPTAKRVIAKSYEQMETHWPASCDTEGNTALHLAARGGFMDVVGLLIENRADINARNLAGETALHMVCDKHILDIVDLLIAKRADPRFGDLVGNEVPGLRAVRRRAEWFRSGDTAPGHFGPEDGLVFEDVPWLEPGLHQRHHLERRFVCIERCLCAMQDFDSGEPPAQSLVNSSGLTALHIAAAASDVEVCELLLRYDASTEAQELDEGKTPLMQAIRAQASVKMLRLLLEAAADPMQRDRVGGAPLHYAAAVGDAGVPAVSLLLEAKAQVDATDEKGACALAIAGLCGAPVVVRALLAAGANPLPCRQVLHMMPSAALSGDGRSCREILERVM